MTDDEVDLQDEIALTNDEYEDLTEAEPKARQVVYSGQDFDVEGLIRRLEKGDIVVPSSGTTIQR